MKFVRVQLNDLSPKTKLDQRADVNMLPGKPIVCVQRGALAWDDGEGICVCNPV